MFLGELQGVCSDKGLPFGGVVAAIVISIFVSMAIGFVLGYIVQRKLRQRKPRTARILENGKRDETLENVYSPVLHKSASNADYFHTSLRESDKNLSQELLNNFKKQTNTDKNNLHPAQ